MDSLLIFLSICFPYFPPVMGDVSWPDGEPGRNLWKLEPSPSHAHTQKPWMGLAAGLRSCVDFMSVGMSLCCCIFMISFDAHTHQNPWRVRVLFILPKSMNPRFIPCSHRIEKNHSKSRNCVCWIPIHTESYSNTSAWLKSQGSTPLCQEHQHKICLSTAGL